MQPKEKDLRINQLRALALAQVERAKQEKVFAGHISPEAAAEIYRICQQILAISEDRELNTDDPSYLFGLYIILLKLHKQRRANEEKLYGRCDPIVIGEIARLESLLSELQKTGAQTPHSAHEQNERLPAITIQDNLQKLLE